MDGCWMDVGCWMDGWMDGYLKPVKPRAPCGANKGKELMFKRDTFFSSNEHIQKEKNKSHFNCEFENGVNQEINFFDPPPCWGVNLENFCSYTNFVYKWNTQDIYKSFDVHRTRYVLVTHQFVFPCLDPTLF